MQFILAVLFLSVAFLTPVQGGIKVIAILFFIGSIVAATNDIAIDGYYMEALDKKGQAKFVGYRVMAYRLAMMTGTGVIVTIGTYTNWLIGFFAAGIILLILFLYHLFFLPDAEKEKYSIFDLFKATLRFKALLTLTSVIAGIFFFRWHFLLTGSRKLRSNYLSSTGYRQQDG